MPHPTKKLGEIARIFSGSSAPQDEKYFKNGKYPFVRVFDLATPRSGTELVETRDYVNELAITELNLVEAQKGAIVFPKSGASILNNNRAMLGTNAYIVSHLSAIEVDEDLAVRNWVYYFLSKFDMGKLVSDPGYPSLNISAIEKIKIPLPPLAIQKQIVERLDKIAEAQKLNDELIKKTDELFQSLLHKELNPAGKDWEVKKLNEVGEIITGTTPSTKNREYWNGEFLWATPTDIKENTFVLMDTPKKLSRGGYERTRPVPKNAILVTCIASIGKMAIAGKEMATNQQINSIVCNKNSDPFFVFFSLQKDKKKLISLGKTTAVPIINKSEFGRIKIFLPPLEIQKQIVTKLSTVQNYKKQLLEQKAKLKELFDSALGKSMASDKKSKDA